MNVGRVYGLFLRHFYLYRGSVPRLLELLYWPLVDILVWGFITMYLRQFEGALPNLVAYFMGGLLLWEVLLRSQIGMSMAYLEEVWSRNLLNLFISPMRPSEFIAASMGIAIIRVAFTSVVSLLIAYLFFDFSVFVMGLWLWAFLASLMVLGWSIGIFISSLILRFGQGAEGLAWGLIFIIQPVAAVFYPVKVLPDFLQPIAYSIPAAYIFEGMRQVLDGSGSPTGNLIAAFALNAVYLAAALIFFYRTLAEAKREGRLLRVGE